MVPQNKSKPIFFIDNIPIEGHAILSPMDGYSDWPFRSICRELGSAMSYTEFINVDDILNNPEKVMPKMFFTEAERPIGIQVYGNEPDRILEAALKVEELRPDFIDFNMGCPFRTIANRGAGVGLMRTPLKVARIFRTLSTHLQVPITGKIRLGWDEDCLNYLLIARIIEENGGKAIALHARTKAQGNRGEVDWNAISELVNNLDIPVIGNGGINSVEVIQKMLKQTGCAAVMVGRSAIGNPWIFSGLDRDKVSPSQVREMIQIHLERNLSFYGKELGLVLFRKFAARYLSPYDLSKSTRVDLLTIDNPAKFLAMLERVDLQDQVLK